MITVERAERNRGRRNGLVTLEQRFRFEGPGVSATAIGDLLLQAPLTGDGSIFGERPGAEGPRSTASRSLRAFSPAPGFRFDVHLERRDAGLFSVRFAQPDRKVPYLQGVFMWGIEDGNGGAVFHEQINTVRALEVGGEPVSGPKPSLRRWLFFRMGHERVMAAATTNIAALLAAVSN